MQKLKRVAGVLQPHDKQPPGRTDGPLLLPVGFGSGAWAGVVFPVFSVGAAGFAMMDPQLSLNSSAPSTQNFSNLIKHLAIALFSIVNALCRHFLTVF